MDLTQMLLFALIMMCTYFIEGMIGFGGAIMALPLASAVIGLKTTVPVMTMIIFAASLVIAIRDFKHINKKQYLIICSLMLIGLPLGMWLFASLPERPLKVALGLFMLFVSIRGLYNMSPKGMERAALKDVTEPSKFVSYLQYGMILFGGIVHGAFAAGGPFVIVYATANIKDKTAFRSTLCAIWGTLDLILIIINAFNGKLTMSMIGLAAISMIFVAFAIYASNIAHKKVDGSQFTKFVYVALLISGFLMMA